MLKLRFLVSNRDLASALLGHWDRDEPADALFDSCRISANAVYPFLRAGRRCFLRFAPVEEKPAGGLAAEIELLRFLRSRGFPAAEVLPARDGRLFVQEATRWGTFEACAFAGAPGRPLEDFPLDDKRAMAWGASLGTLHRLSREYRPEGPPRWSHADVLSWVEAELRVLGKEEPALAECGALRARLATLPTSRESYGLVHFDFEPDNLLVADDDRCTVIDFDDAMYAWYMVDVDRALASVEGAAGPLGAADREACFLEGYAGTAGARPALAGLRPAFRRFADLYGYARVRRVLASRRDDEPAWMGRLREKLESIARRRSSSFGAPLP